MPETENRICKKKLSESRFLTFRKSFGHIPQSLILILALGLFGCNTTSEKIQTAQSRQLFSQIKEGTPQILNYTKIFRNLSKEEKEAETLIMPVDKFGRDSIETQLKQDLAYLFEIYYQDESVIAFLDTSYVGDTLIARVKKGMEKKSKLQEQKILKTKEGSYRFVSTRTYTSNWLYSLGISIQAEFDSLTKYRRHHLYLKNRVHYLNETLESDITGEAIYQK